MTIQGHTSNTATYGLLHDNISNHHPIVEEVNYTDIHNRNKILKERLLEKHTSEAVNLPIVEFRYSKYIYNLFYIYIRVQYLMYILS